MREVIFESGTHYPRTVLTRRIGKPRANWLTETYKDAWSRIDAQNPLDINDQAHLNILAARALARETPFSNKNS